MAVFHPNIDDDEEEPQVDRRDFIWNFLTVLVLLAMLAGVVWFVLVFKNPSISLNPYPPPTIPPRLDIPTITLTSTPEPPTDTPGPTATVTETLTPSPVLPTSTIVGMDRLLTPTETFIANTIYPFAIKSQPAAIDVTVLYPDRNKCKWMGVGGQVLDIRGGGNPGVTVQLGGYADGRDFLLTSLTGTASKYGVAGYEFTLDDAGTFASQGDLWIRLLDQQGIQISSKIYFDTFDDCSKTLVIINFQQIRE